MDAHMVAQQAMIEHEALQHVKQALRVALNWQTTPETASRKISSVRFMAQSLERHLERLMVIEEDGGYMEVVVEVKPNYESRVAPLRRDHQAFRAELIRIMQGLKEVQPNDAMRVAAVRNDLGQLLAQLDAHDKTETLLLQDVLMNDEGGEG